MQEHAETVDRHVVAVDDEPLFLRFAEIPFRTGFCGYCTWHVHAFSDPAEALAFYERYAAQVDVLLTDYHMPTVNGLDLIDHMRACGPSRAGTLPALLVTSDPPMDVVFPERTSLVRKPFTNADIAQALCDVSVVCQTGRCPSAGHAKPQPPAELARPLGDRETSVVYG